MENQKMVREEMTEWKSTQLDSYTSLIYSQKGNQLNQTSQTGMT